MTVPYALDKGRRILGRTRYIRSMFHEHDSYFFQFVFICTAGTGSAEDMNRGGTVCILRVGFGITFKKYLDPLRVSILAGKMQRRTVFVLFVAVIDGHFPERLMNYILRLTCRIKSVYVTVFHGCMFFISSSMC